MFYLGDVALFLAFALGVMLLSWAGGRERWALSGASLLERDLILFSACLGLIGTLTWLLGTVNTRSVAVLTFFAPLALSALCLLNSDVRASISARFRALRDGLRALALPDKLLLSYVALVSALTFALTLAPPSGGDYDSLVYHLAAPQRYLDAGRVVELPYDHHTYFPFTVEMWFMLGLAVKGPVLAKMFHWICLPLGCAVIWAFGRRHLGARAGSYGAAIYASLPVVQSEATTAYIDLGFSLWVLLALGCLANWRANAQGAWLFWAGAFAGLALGSKYLGALTVGFVGVYALGRMLVARQPQARALLGFSVLALIVGGGWYLRNVAWTGNPVFPFAYGAFGGQGWTAQRAEAYTQSQLIYGFGRGSLDLLLSPWRLSMSPLNAAALPDGRTVGLPFWPLLGEPRDNGTTGLFETPGFALQVLLGPALLAFGLPALFARRPPALNIWLGATAFFGLFWFLTGQYLRYLLPAFGLVCFACGFTLAKIEARSKFLRAVATACLVAWLAFTPMLTIKNAGASLSVVTGQVTPEAYLSRTFAPYDAMQWLNTNARNGTVAVYGEPRTFHLRAPYFWADEGHNTLIDSQKARTPQGLIAALRERGATHVLRREVGGAFGPPASFDEAVRKGLLREVFATRDRQGRVVCRVLEVPSGGVR